VYFFGGMLVFLTHSILDCDEVLGLWVSAVKHLCNVNKFCCITFGRIILKWTGLIWLRMGNKWWY
jgi:hypothetical protein